MSKTTKVFARAWGWHPKITVYPSQCTGKGEVMILAKEYEGELWIKASLHNQEVKRAVEAEREACAKVAEERLLDKANCTAEQMYELQKKSIAAAIRARGKG
jgi:hypothetical protein